MTKIKPQLLMTFGLLALGLTLAACIPKATNTNNNANQEQDQAAATEDKNDQAEAIMAADQNVTLRTQNNSGQSGSATLTAMGDQTKVVLSVAGGLAGVAQPAHIHHESCANIGGVLYPLSAVTDGSSETILNVSLDTIMSQLPLSINVHKSAQEASVYVACGDIAGAAMVPAQGESASDGDDNDKSSNPTNTNSNANQTNTNTNIAATKTFNISARNFAFSQAEIRVKEGDKVKIVLNSTDGFHDWTVDEFNAKTDQVNTGQTAEVEFVADKTGTFEYYCSVGSHRQMGMVGKLIVE